MSLIVRKRAPFLNNIMNVRNIIDQLAMLYSAIWKYLVYRLACGLCCNCSISLCWHVSTFYFLISTSCYVEPQQCFIGSFHYFIANYHHVWYNATFSCDFYIFQLWKQNKSPVVPVLCKSRFCLNFNRFSA